MRFIPGIQDSSIYPDQSMWIKHVNKLENKNPIIISIDAEKGFAKTQHPFIIKDSPWRGHIGNISQHNKVYIWQTHSKPNSQWGKTEKNFL